MNTKTLVFNLFGVAKTVGVAEDAMTCQFSKVRQHQVSLRFACGQIDHSAQR